MIVEPYSNERVEENLNPVGRISYNASSSVSRAGSGTSSGRSSRRLETAGDRHYWGLQTVSKGNALEHKCVLVNLWFRRVV